MNRTVLVVGALLTLPLLVFLGLGLTKDPHTIDSPLIGQAAPLFTLADLDGNIFRLEELKGRPVVVNFWASWCQPCKLEHPILLAASRRFQEKVSFVGVIYQDDPDLMRRIIATTGSYGVSLADPDSKIAIAYGVYGVPETFLIDATGMIREKITGPVHPDTFFSKIEGML
jgi:cytochrome c biogenesis protein CcmG/thiol:disulfide interchange protein DsbE